MYPDESAPALEEFDRAIRGAASKAFASAGPDIFADEIASDAADKGYGFLSSGPGADVFVFQDDVTDHEARGPLKEGEAVTFTVSMYRGKPKALDVERDVPVPAVTVAPPKRPRKRRKGYHTRAEEIMGGATPFALLGGVPGLGPGPPPPPPPCPHIFPHCH